METLDLNTFEVQATTTRASIIPIRVAKDTWLLVDIETRNRWIETPYVEVGSTRTGKVNADAFCTHFRIDREIRYVL